MTKKAIGVSVVCVVVLVTGSMPPCSADDPIQGQILKLYPQADSNGDGVLSKAEKAALSRQALKRYPKADKNGDGVLSEAEQKALLRAAANRKRPNPTGPAAGKSSAADKAKKTPTYANVSYGDHERNVFDIWLAESDEPTPLAIYIHGGGFRAGSKEKLKADSLSQLLDAGISVASINYRYLTIAPLPAAHHDARRALQFMRSKAVEWNIDKNRVAAFGGSAGAQICMWLAYTDEMANSESADPVERESTRLTCVATAGGQTANSAEFWRETIGPLLGENRNLESLARPLGNEQDPENVRILTWGAKTLEEANRIAAQHAALNIVSEDDPPIFMSYGMSPTAKLPSDPQRVRGWLIHHVNLGIALKKRTDELKLEAHLKYPGSESKYESLVEFFVDKFKDK